MNENMKLILDKIKEYDKILIFRHFRPDGDAIGSTKGLQRILQLTFPEKKIYLQNNDFSDYLAFLGEEDAPLFEEEYVDALGLVLDTGTAKRISNQKYSLCKEIIKFDHHIPLESYGDYEWVEEHRSSTCEMVAAFYDAFKDELKIDKEAATYIYCGMVTDSGRFRFRSVSGETMRLAGILLDMGIDTDTLYAHLYLKDFDSLKFQSYVYKKMKMTENGVAYIYVDKKMQEKFNMTPQEASQMIGTLDSIKGSLIWLAFIDNPEGSIRVRLRSRFLDINDIAALYNGGGHGRASGATVENLMEMKFLIKDCNKKLRKFKKENKEWL